MKTHLHFINSAVTAFVFARSQLRFKIICDMAEIVVSAGSATAQTTPVKAFPIRGGTQPFAITMGEDGSFWFTLANSSEVAGSLRAAASITPGPQA